MTMLPANIPKNSAVIKPQDGGQWDFLACSAFEGLFGGQAGPGKSWGLVIDALGLQFIKTPLGKAAVEVPEYRAVLFRRKTTQFSKLIDEGKKYYTKPPFNAEYVQGRRGDPGPSFNFPSGARIFVCHMEHEDNKEDHQGIEYQFVGFDELTQFKLTQYIYLFSRCRSAIPYLWARVRSTTNPTGIGLIWVKKRFIKNGSITLQPKKIYSFTPDPERDIIENPMGVMVDNGAPRSKTRTFIPGLLCENKILMDADPDYENNIIAMGKKFENALLKGDWDAFGGDFFDDFGPQMKIPPFEIPKEWKLIGSLDPGWSSGCSFGLRARDFEGNIYRLFTYYRKGASPTQYSEDIRRILEGFPWTDGRMPSITVSGTDAWAHKDRHAIVSHDLTFFDVFKEKTGLHLLPANTNRVIGWWAMKDIMRNNKYFYFDGYNDPWVEQITSAEQDERNPEDIKKDANSEDHCLDEDRYGMMAAIKPFDYKQQEAKKMPHTPDETVIPFGIDVGGSTDPRLPWD